MGLLGRTFKNIQKGDNIEQALEKASKISHFNQSANMFWQKKNNKDAKFLEKKEEKQILSPDNDGLLIDGQGKRLSSQDSFKNLCVVATTGAGKTTSFIIPNLLTLDNCSIVVTDPSGELYNSTSYALHQKGFNIKAINFSNLEQSLSYNPLARAKSLTDIKKISDILVRSANPNSQGEDFWLNQAKTIINILMKCLKNQGKPQYLNLHNLYYLLNEFNNLSQFIITNTKDKGDLLTLNEFKGFASSDEKVLQGALSTAKASLEAISDPDIAKLTATDTIQFETLRQEKTILYLIVPESEMKYYSFILNLLYTQLFQYSLKEQNQSQNLPIYYLLDEFGNLFIPDFSSIITTSRKKNISISIMLQSLSQLISKYGREEAETILDGGIASKIFFSGLNIKTCQDLEKTMGEISKEERDENGKLIYSTKEPLIPASQIRTMASDEIIYLFANKNPLKTNIRAYHKNKKMVKATEQGAYCLQDRASENEVEFLKI